MLNTEMAFLILHSVVNKDCTICISGTQYIIKFSLYLRMLLASIGVMKSVVS